MNYGNIIKQSFNIVWKNKFLWFLGLFLSGGFGGQMYSSAPSDFDSDKLNNFLKDNNLKSLEKVASADTGRILGTIDAPTTLLIVLGVILLIVFCLLVYVSLVARGAATFAIADIAKGLKTDLKKTWHKGSQFFWRRFRFGLLVLLASFIVLAFLTTPVVLLAIFKLNALAIILGIIFGIVLIVFFMYLSLIMPIAERLLFLNDTRVVESFKVGAKMFNRSWLDFVLLYLISAGINITCAAVYFITLALVALFLFLIAYFLFMINNILSIIFGGVLVLILLIISITVFGALSSFSWSMITLGFVEKNK